MKQEHKLIAGIVVLVALGIGVYFVMQEEDKRASAHAPTAAQDLPVVKMAKEEAEKITKFVIKNKDKGEVTLEKKGDKWEITAPISAPANEANVKTIVTNLEKIEPKAIIASSADVYKKYELDEEQAVHVRAFKGDENVLDMYFGKSGSRGQMARFGGKDAAPTVYAVKGYSSYSWARELKNWRHNEILKFEDGNVIAAEVENENGKFSFTKDDDKWAAKFYERKEGKLAAKGADIERFDEARVKDLLRAYKNLKATNFAEKDDDTGVGEPLEHGGIIRFTMKDEDAPKYIVKVGKKQEGSNRYLAHEGDETVYVVTSWAADWATAEVEKFQKPEEKKDDKDGDKDGDKDKKGDKKDAKKPAKPPEKKDK